MKTTRSILVYYEHPDWFRPLFAELERRGIAHVRLDASRHAFDPARLEVGPETLVFNRMSPSAWKRGRAHAIPHTLQWLRVLEHAGVPTVNGVDAFTVETSKALQIAMIEGLGLSAPRTRVVNHATALPEAAASLEFPLLVKPNIGGSGAGIVRFDDAAALEAAVERDEIPSSIDDVLLLQEYHAPEGSHIVRVETLDGDVLYAIKVHLAPGAGFNLCPAEICRDAHGQVLASSACPAGAATTGVAVEAWDPPIEVREEVEAIAREARLDVGGIEYLVSERDGRRHYYDVNALSNFVADPVRVLGFDPTIALVDTLVKRASAAAPRARRDRLVPRAPLPAGLARPGEALSGAAAPPVSVSSWSEEMAPAALPASRSIVAPIDRR